MGATGDRGTPCPREGIGNDSQAVLPVGRELHRRRWTGKISHAAPNVSISNPDCARRGHGISRSAVAPRGPQGQSRRRGQGLPPQAGLPARRRPPRPRRRAGLARPAANQHAMSLHLAGISRGAPAARAVAVLDGAGRARRRPPHHPALPPPRAGADPRRERPGLPARQQPGTHALHAHNDIVNARRGARNGLASRLQRITAVGACARTGIRCGAYRPRARSCR